MKILYLMGGSGCGKTTLAKHLEEYNPEIYKRIVQITTRKMRPGEVEGVEYHFFTPEEFKNRRSEMYETVEHQFPGAQYGGRFSDLNEEKWNIAVVSIEGFLDSVINLKKREIGNTEQILVNIINDCPLDIDRDGRDPGAEERINLGVLRPFKKGNTLEINGSTVKYAELNLSYLKTFRNDREKCLEYFKNLFKEN